MNWMGGYRKPNRLSKKDKEKQDQFFARKRLEKQMNGNRNPSGTTPSIPTPADIFFASKMGSALPHAGSSGISPFTRGSHVTSERQPLPCLDHKRNAHPIPNNERQSDPPDPLTKWCAVLQEDFKSKSNSNYRGEREKTNVGFNNKIPAYSCSLQNQNMIEPYPGSSQPNKQLAANFSYYDDKMDKFKTTEPPSQFSINYNETPKGDKNSTSKRPEVSQTFKEDCELGYISCVENEQESVFIRKECNEENPFIEEVVEMRYKEIFIRTITATRRKIPTSKILTPPPSASSKGGYQPYTRNLESNKRSSFQMENERNSGNEGFSSLYRKMPIQRSSPIQNSKSSQKKNEVLNENSKNLQKKEIKTAVINLEDSLATQYQEWLMTKIMDELYFELPTELKQSLECTESVSEVSSYEEYTQDSNVSRNVTQQSQVSGVSLRSKMKIVEITTMETSVQTDANSSQTMKEVSVQTSFESPKIKKDFEKAGTTVETMVQTDSNSSQMMKEVSVQTSFESPKTKKDFKETGIQYNEFEMASYFHPHKRICYSV